MCEGTQGAFANMTDAHHSKPNRRETQRPGRPSRRSPPNYFSPRVVYRAKIPGGGLSPRAIRWLVLIFLTVVLGWPLTVVAEHSWGFTPVASLFLGAGIACFSSYAFYVVIERFIEMRRRALYARGLELGEERKARRRGEGGGRETSAPRDRRS